MRALRIVAPRASPRFSIPRSRHSLVLLSFSFSYRYSNHCPKKSWGGGDLTGEWSVRVSGNWRVVFRFENDEAVDLDLVDYH
ncbi:MAG: hypothetical protein F4Z21_11445 [Acidobacteria bacterium]|nr:hypothetical protein [Acidobacteriota bacterium]